MLTCSCESPLNFEKNEVCFIEIGAETKKLHWKITLTWNRRASAAPHTNFQGRCLKTIICCSFLNTAPISTKQIAFYSSLCREDCGPVELLICFNFSFIKFRVRNSLEMLQRDFKAFVPPQSALSVNAALKHYDIQKISTRSLRRERFEYRGKEMFVG